MEPEEIPRLENLYKRGQENNVRDLRMIGPEEIKKIEPNCVVSKHMSPVVRKSVFKVSSRAQLAQLVECQT